MPAEITALILRGAAWVNTVVVTAGNVQRVSRETAER
jgi:hypothetical protein